jgi:hypothetical protein
MTTIIVIIVLIIMLDILSKGCATRIINSVASTSFDQVREVL